MIGRTLAHYRVTAAIGSGGMGKVYRATDTKLGRDVALKVLPAEMASRPERLERFRREAKALAALDHPGIVTVHSVEEAGGVHFLTMQLVEGKPLDQLIPAGGLPVARILEIATALADALAAAHEKGIVHRDLKPANVMVTNEGRVKVLDFGLAKWSAAEESSGSDLPTDLHTREGAVLGTVPYMSPEQVQGRTVDYRTDIFSLGVLLYEMATGHRPFRSDSAAGLMSAILRDTPEPAASIRADLPETLHRVIESCLHKDPADRVQSAREVRRALERPSQPTADRTPMAMTASSRASFVSGDEGSLIPAGRPDSSPGRPEAIRIAVLPFANTGSDPDLVSFADGLAEDILTGLSRFSHLFVVSRNSPARYKDQAVDVHKVGEELGARYVMEGRIRKAGTAIRVNVQMVDALAGTQLWAETYDRDLASAGIFALQDEITDRVVATVADPFGALARSMAAQTAEKPPGSLTPYEVVLRTESLVEVTKRHKRGAVLALTGLLAAGAGLAFWLSPWTGQRQAPPARIIPFTTLSGAADQPAFSPDGNQIAFTWDGGSGGNVDIYVKLIGAGTPLRLTSDPAEDFSPAWSPDGRNLAFLRRSAGENGVFIVPALGGAERKLAKTEPNQSRGLAWSPEGKFLAVVDRASPQHGYGIFLLSVEDGEKQELTSPGPSPGSNDSSPACSPDGKTLAFLRTGGLISEDIYLIPMHGGKLQRLTADERRIHSLAWTADGSEIVFSSNRGGGFSLWRVAVSGGTPERVAVAGQNVYSPAISRQGNRLAYNVSFLDSNIWRIDRRPSAHTQNSPARLIASTRQDHSPQFSPDGKRIVFASDRSGNDEIWVSESDGSHPAQLTFFDSRTAGTPRWSPDSQQVVFDARPAGNSDIFVMSAEGGKPRPLTLEPSHDVIPSWSRDGRWIYFCSNRSGALQIWKVPASGGQAVQVTKQGGLEAFESPDGKLLYYTRGRGLGGIWQVPVGGGEERPVPKLPDAGYWRYWAVLDEGICFVAPVASARPVIKFFSFATHRVMQIGVLERDPLRGPPGLTVSPDGRWVLYAQADQSISDIMLVEDFR